MKKKNIIIFLFGLLLIVGSLVIYDFSLFSKSTTQLENIQILVNKLEKEKGTEVSIKIVGELPQATTRLTIFADNRFLEFQADNIQNEIGVTYDGQTAGGAETNFIITPEFDGDLTVHYSQKQNDNTSPLIYAYLKSDLKRNILSDKIIRSKNFE
ncbi:hypothetical protein [Brevibacillus migulae]|uniref:hypothetical protein n=1 Tax=Brevibacillus migulae TaxID=1644114 RepID=UPI00106DD7FC|nr:hypothetical protein [Brevibacillus migulae]